MVLEAVNKLDVQMTNKSGLVAFIGFIKLRCSPIVSHFAVPSSTTFTSQHAVISYRTRYLCEIRNRERCPTEAHKNR